MELLTFLLAGIIMGLPFGPVGILCMGKTIEQGKKNGFAGAMGAVAVDLIYGVVAFLSLNVIKDDINSHEFILKIIVGIFLIIVGYGKTFGKVEINREKTLTVTSTKIESNNMAKKNFVKIFLISLPNVFNIVTIITVFTALEVFKFEGKYTVLYVVFGMGIGEVIFWYFTTTVLDKLRNKINDKIIGRVVRACGGAVLLFGLSLEFQAIVSKIK